MKKLLSLLAACIFLFSSKGQDQSAPILFIYDASGSMWGQIEGKAKKEIASSVLGETVNNLPASQELGLIAYGHRTKGDCDDIEYMVDLTNTSKPAITSAVNGLNPLGKTPLARSATLAINSLKESGTSATIILITDGIESCDGDLCKVVGEARAAGIDFKLHIVGFGLKEGEKEALKCAAAAGNGRYYDAGNTEGLSAVLQEATTQTVDKPDNNFTVYAVKNGTPVDAWVRVKDFSSGKDKGGVRTYRDTSHMFLPAGKYSVEIRALENADVDPATIVLEMEDQPVHRDISFDSGKIKVTVFNNEEGWDATVKAVLPGTRTQVSGARTYGKTIELEVNPGSYDLQIQILRIEGISTFFTMENVKVGPGGTTEVSHKFESGIAMVGVQTSSGELIDATVNFTEISTGKNVAGSRTYTSASSNPREFILNPGTYDVKVMTLGVHKGHTETFRMTVTAGETVTKSLTF